MSNDVENSTVQFSDARFMERAIQLAGKGRYTTDPNPAVGCVIVNHGEIVGQGWHQFAGGPHAEINALQQAGDKARGASVYVTLEPCSHTGKTPPCADALIAAGVSKVVAAMTDPNPLVAGEGLKKLQAAGITTEAGLLQQQAQELNPGFIKRMQTGRPFVRVKLAMSLDGRTAMASGESQWISSEASRTDVQYLRAESSAILTGIETVLADDPSMNVRLSAEQLQVDRVRQPHRIVLDSQLRLPTDAKIAGLDGDCTVYTTVNVDNADRYPFNIVTLQGLASGEKADTGSANERPDRAQIDLQALMADLGSKEINLLHVEAGSVLCGALLKNDLVDEIILYVAPHIMGSSARGLFSLPGLNQMKDRIPLEIKDLRTIGNDIRITARPVPSPRNTR